MMKRAVLCLVAFVGSGCKQLPGESPAQAAVGVQQQAIGPPTVPTGALLPFAGTSAPNGYLLCDGSIQNSSTLPALFAVIGTTYGTGDGTAGSFNLPDLRGRTAFGKDDMGGTAANRLTAAGSGFDGETLGAAGGAQSHVLTVDEMPSHAHAVVDNGHSHATDTSVDYVPPSFEASSNDGTAILPDVVTPDVFNLGNHGFQYSNGDFHGSFRVAPGSVSVLTNVETANSNVTVSPTGGGNPLATVSPGVVVNYIIKS